MSSFKATVILSGMLISTASIAMAADPDRAPSKFQEHVSEMLAAQGFTSIRAVGKSEVLLIAFDTEGSEVFLTVRPEDGTIEDSEYTYSMDR